MRIISVVLLIFLILLQNRLWFGKNSVTDYYGLISDVERQVNVNTKLMTRNKILYADIADLKSGVQAIEESARNELGMIKQGETFFRIIPKESNATQFNRQNNEPLTRAIP